VTSGKIAVRGPSGTGYSKADFTVGGVLDPGFELQHLTARPPANYIYAPYGTPWMFTQSSGIAGNSSTLTALNGPAPEGTQVAFLQDQGAISQTLMNLQAGTYTLSFYAAQRQNGQTVDHQAIAILVDGKQVGQITPAGTTYTTYNVSFTVAAGNHTIKFAGTAVQGTNSTAFIDAVSLAEKPQ
jgi:hypothetical protein